MGNVKQLRALLNQGSEESFVIEKTALSLQLPRYRGTQMTIFNCNANQRSVR